MIFGGKRKMKERKLYPRPELVRENWTDLCGRWEFDFDFGASARERGVPAKAHLDREITVPFCPESELSGIGYKDFMNGCVYKKKVILSPKSGSRILLNFEAVYYKTEVFVNAKSVGTHIGGYTPFSFDITEFVSEGENDITVCCEADSRACTQPSGKQSERYASHGCSYTRSTGIYAPVWMEEVPAAYLRGIRLDSDTDNARLNVQAFLGGKGEKKVRLEAFLGGKSVGSAQAKTVGDTIVTSIGLSELALWNPDSPVLYDLEITVCSESGCDKVKSYFGMRKVEMDGACLLINGKRIFQRLVLDQGYYGAGIYTAEDDGDFLRDIERARRLGFNGARLHQRVFERRFLYEADKTGYIVWGEYANWGFDHTREGMLHYFLPEWLEAMERDYNHPALIGWCPFNETWDAGNGKRQDDSLLRDVYEVTKRVDRTRPCIDTSGNYHVVTDIYDIHDYCQDIASLHRRYDKFEEGDAFENRPGRQQYRGEPYMISEYGGIRWTNDESGWGYGEAPKTLDEYVERYCSMIQIFAANPRICGVCYTQLYDVEQEQNGIYNYDRTPKFDDETMNKLAEAMSAPAAIEIG